MILAQASGTTGSTIVGDLDVPQEVKDLWDIVWRRAKGEIEGSEPVQDVLRKIREEAAKGAESRTRVPLIVAGGLAVAALITAAVAVFRK